MGSPILTQTRPGTAGTGLISDHVNRINPATGLRPNQEDYPATKDVPWAEELNQAWRAVVGAEDTLNGYDLFIGGINVVSNARRGYFVACEADGDGLPGAGEFTTLRADGIYASVAAEQFGLVYSPTLGAWYLLSADGTPSLTDPGSDLVVGGLQTRGTLEQRDPATGASWGLRHVSQVIDLTVTDRTSGLIPAGVAASDVKVTALVLTDITGGSPPTQLQSVNDSVVWAEFEDVTQGSLVLSGMGGAAGDGGKFYEDGLDIRFATQDGDVFSGGTVRIEAFYIELGGPEL